MQGSVREVGEIRVARVNWQSVFFYYVLACSISWPIFWIRDRHPQVWNSWQFPIYFNKGWLPALGPFVACLLALLLFSRSHHKRMSLFGTSPLRALYPLALLLAGLTIVGVGTDQPHLTGFLFALTYVIYALLEECGWRGFLQDALRPLPEKFRYPLIGVLWGVWHFTTFTGGTPWEASKRLLFMAVLWIAGSWGIGIMVERTRSLIVAAILHLVFNLTRALPLMKILPVFALCALAFVILLRKWPSPEPETVREAGI